MPVLNFIGDKILAP